MRLNRWKWLLREGDGGREEGGGDEAPGGPLSDWVDWVLDRFLADRDGEWPDDPTREELSSAFENATKGFLQAPEPGAVGSGEPTLWLGQEELPWPRISSIPDDEAFQRQLRETAEVEVVADTVGELTDTGHRALEVAGRALARPPGHPVTAFWARMGRCYIAGLLPECLLLCRTALEGAASRAATREGLLQDDDGERPPTTAERLDALHAVGALSEEGRGAAKAVWAQGERALEGDAGGKDEVLEAIVRTSEILTELDPDS